MGRKKRKAPVRGKYLPTETLLPPLQARAMSLAHENGHLLSVWQSSKRLWGRASKQARCVNCRQIAVIMPRGSNGCSTYPRIQGEVLFTRCGGGG